MPQGTSPSLERRDATAEQLVREFGLSETVARLLAAAECLES